MQANATINVKNLSDRRLWELLRMAEIRDPRIPPLTIDHVRGELHSRQQCTEARRFHSPR